jgi:hypothetical protein
MNIDVTKMTMEERRDILWAILPKWVGPLALPGTGDENKCLAVMPMVSEKDVLANQEAGICAMVNRVFKPHRLIIQEVPYTVTRWEEQPTRWWQRKKPNKPVTEPRLMARNEWSLDSFFVGDHPILLKVGAILGDAFGLEHCLNFDCPTAQLGQCISFRVCHHGPTAVPFRALLLGTVMKHEEDQMPFIPTSGEPEADEPEATE